MKYVLVGFLLIGSLNFLQGQTPYVINQNTNKSLGGDNAGMGSSFLTIGSGYLDSIEVIIRTGTYTSGSFYVFNGNTNDTTLRIHNELATGIPTGAELSYMIRVSSNVFLNAASTYTFMLYNAPLRFGPGDVYLDGALWTGAGFLPAGEHTGYDLDFVAYIGLPPVTTGIDVDNADADLLIYQGSNGCIKLKNFYADEIRVNDLQGKLIASGRGDELHLGDFAEGVYIVSATKGKQIYTSKLFLKR